MPSPAFRPIGQRLIWRVSTGLFLAMYLVSTFIPAFVPQPTLASPDGNLVLGQANFTTNTYISGVASASSMSTAADVFVTATHVFVADSANNRILIWKNDGSLQNGAPATLVLGQADFTSMLPNRGGTVAANTLNLPRGVYYDGRDLYVADMGNNRVLVWMNIDFTSLQNGAAATNVIGQPDFTSNSGNRGAATPSDKSLSNPMAVASDGNNSLYIADVSNNRVMIWNIDSALNGDGARAVLGQTNFTSNGINQGAGQNTATASSLNLPRDVFVDGSQVYVADFGNSRVLIWNTVNPDIGSAATYVVGQTDFSSTQINRGQSIPTAMTLSAPRGLYVAGGRLFVADTGNDRVLVWNTTTPAINATASAVIGQDTFMLNGPNRGRGFFSSPDLKSLQTPQGIYSDGQAVWVAEETNHRVVRFAGVMFLPIISITDYQATTMQVTVNENGNLPGTQYAIEDLLTQRWTAVDDSLTSATATYHNPTVINVTGLTPNTRYVLVSQARNSGLNDTSGPSAPAIAYTKAAIPTNFTATAGGTDRITLNWNANGNPTSTQYELIFDNGTAIVTTTNTTHTVTGLSAGTSYSFRVRALGNNTPTLNSAYAGPVSATTNSAGGGSIPTAAIPTNLTATAGGTDRINVSWSANGNPAGTRYELIFDNGTAIITTTNTAYVVTGLSAGTTYSFRVRALSNDTSSLNSAYAGPVSATTNSAGGGNLPGQGNAGSGSGGSSGGIVGRAPTGTIAINGGDANTTNRNVFVLLTASNTTQIGLVNVSQATTTVNSIQDLAQIAIPTTSGQLANIAFVPLPQSGRLQWTLAPGNGVKTVCAVLRGTDPAEIAIRCDSITLTEAVFTCPLEIGRPYKTPSHPAVYLIVQPFDRAVTHCTKRVFENEDKYFSYFVGWGDIRVVSQQLLESVSSDAIAIIPWGPKFNPREPAFVKTIQNRRVYYVHDGIKEWFDTSEPFAAMGFAWRSVQDVDDSFLNQYTVGSVITDTARHPNGTLFRYIGSDRIYKIDSGQKRWIPDVRAFMTLGFNPDTVVMISPTETYPSGTPMEIQEVFEQFSRIPDVKLLKRPNNPKVYLIDQNQKRHVTHQSLFASFGWRWQDIVTVEANDLDYADGAAVRL